MSIRHVIIQATAASAAVLPLVLAGCVSTSGDVQGARLSDNFQVYAPFDNERDWGPSYLVGAPSHHFGDESRVDDTRSIPQNADAGASPADPSGPPLTGSPSPNGSAPQAGSAPPASPQPPP
jgi:hypothetical protein